MRSLAFYLGQAEVKRQTFATGAAFAEGLLGDPRAAGRPGLMLDNRAYVDYLEKSALGRRAGIESGCGGHRSQFFQRFVHQAPERGRVVLLDPVSEAHVEYGHARLSGEDRRIR